MNQVVEICIYLVKILSMSDFYFIIIIFFFLAIYPLISPFFSLLPVLMQPCLGPYLAAIYGSGKADAAVLESSLGHLNTKLNGKKYLVQVSGDLWKL